MDKIKAVIFDLDETLINRKIAFRGLCDYFIDKYAPQFPYQGTREELVAYMIAIDECGYGGIRSFLPKLRKRWELPLTIDEFISERNENFVKFTTVFPVTHEVLKTLKENYKLGVITNGFSSVQREKIKIADIKDYFDDIIISGEVEMEKPDPRIFLLSCRHLGVKPEEAVFVGDYYPNDIAGAIKAKIKPIWIVENPEEYKEYEGIRINKLEDLLEIL